MLALNEASSQFQTMRFFLVKPLSCRFTDYLLAQNGSKTALKSMAYGGAKY
jgi:hypothetical protein